MKRPAHLALALALAAALLSLFGPVDREPITRGRVLDGWTEPMQLRLAAYRMVAGDVAADRRPLWEAAGLFRELNRLPPIVIARPHLPSPVHIPVDTEAGWLCRQVVDWVRLALADDPARATAVVARLEAEARAALARPDAPLLPAAGAGEVEALLAECRRRQDRDGQRAVVP